MKHVSRIVGAGRGAVWRERDDHGNSGKRLRESSLENVLLEWCRGRTISEVV